MTRTDAYESDYLGLLFTNISIANIGDAGGILKSVADGVFFISLHTSDPGETGDQTTNEATYGAYARKSVARGVAEWTVAGTAPTTALQSKPEGGTSRIIPSLVPYCPPRAFCVKFLSTMFVS